MRRKSSEREIRSCTGVRGAHLFYSCDECKLSLRYVCAYFFVMHMWLVTCMRIVFVCLCVCVCVCVCVPVCVLRISG